MLNNAAAFDDDDAVGSSRVAAALRATDDPEVRVACRDVAEKMASDDGVDVSVARLERLVG